LSLLPPKIGRFRGFVNRADDPAAAAPLLAIGTQYLPEALRRPTVPTIERGP
jgi:hypothetical protein